MAKKTPIALIAGTLGSGKTTLLGRILEETGRRIAVLMNEFGEIAIDSEVIKGENIEIVELAGGCVCCSLTGEFEEAISEIIEKVAPEFIMVEATGVAEADALVYEVEDNIPMVRLDSVICIVDSYTSVRFPRVGYTARTQLQAADIVLINKIDLVSPGDVESVIEQVRDFNETAAIFKTEKCDVDVDLLFGLNVEKRAVFHINRGGPEFRSFTYTTDRSLNREKFHHVVSDLPLSIYRGKGFVRFAGETCLFNYVVGRTDLETHQGSGTRLVFIGEKVDKLKDDILEKLRGCEE